MLDLTLRRAASTILITLVVLGGAFSASALAKSHRSSPATRSAAAASSSGLITDNSKTECAYAANSLSYLSQFESLVGTTVNCALVFNDEAPAWANWEAPYFTGTNPDTDWSKWVRQVPGRTLIITQAMIPQTLDADASWRAEGAAGDFNGYARQLARNLVAAGLGGSVIRLGHEANGTWYADNVGDTPAQYAEWVQTWRQEVIAMRSVTGAHFRFDWCVNAGYRDIPLADFYPGNDVVNIVGVDAYDSGVQGSGSARWNTLLHQPDGLGAVAAFAKANHKPLSLPEWGLGTASGNDDYSGAGDDPAYVDGIGKVVADDEVAFQSYFFHNSFAATLSASRLSLAAYKAYFSRKGLVARALVRSRRAAARAHRRSRHQLSAGKRA